MKQRPLNRCGSCGHTWKPKGSSLSTYCPNCNSTDTRYDVRHLSQGDDEEEQSETASQGRLFSEKALSASSAAVTPYEAMGAPAHVAHPTQRSARTGGGGASPEKGGRRIGPVLVLLLVVVATIGGLVYWRMQPSSMTSVSGCKQILERLDFSKKQMRKGKKRWKKWVRFWRVKALEEKCFE